MVNSVVNGLSFVFNLIMSLPISLFQLILFSWFLGAVSAIFHGFWR